MVIPGRLFEVSGGPSHGEWTFIVGGSFIVGIRAVDDLDALGSFDALVPRTDARVEELVAAIPQADADGSFAIVAEIAEPDGDETGVTVVVRGETAVDIFSVGGWRRITDQGIRPWLLADFQATTAIVIGSTADLLVEIDRLDRTPVSDSARVFSADRLVWSLAADRTAPARHAKPDAPARHAKPDAPAETENGFAPEDRQGAPNVHDTVLVPRLQGSAAWTPPPIPDAPMVRVASPEVYRFRVGAHEVLLTETAYIGRNPRPPRIRSSESSLLVSVDSATREVSGTHLKVEQVGNTVVATDLASANGTIVTIPGAAPVRLRSTESLVVCPGTRLDIGDGNIVEILTIVSAPAVRAAAPPTGVER